MVRKPRGHMESNSHTVETICANAASLTSIVSGVAHVVKSDISSMSDQSSQAIQLPAKGKDDPSHEEWRAETAEVSAHRTQWFDVLEWESGERFGKLL